MNPDFDEYFKQIWEARIDKCIPLILDGKGLND
jgi:hypothetical protein